MTPNLRHPVSRPRSLQGQILDCAEGLQTSQDIFEEIFVEDQTCSTCRPDHTTSVKMSSSSKNPFRKRPRSKSEKIDKPPKTTFNDLATAYSSIRGGEPAGFSKSSPTSRIRIISIYIIPSNSFLLDTPLPSSPLPAHQRPKIRRSRSFSQFTTEMSLSDGNAFIPFYQIGSLDSKFPSKSESPVQEKFAVPPSRLHMSWSAFAAAHPHLTEQELGEIKAAWPNLPQEYFGNVNEPTSNTPRSTGSAPSSARRRSASLRALDFPSQFNESLSDPFVDCLSGSTTGRGYTSGEIPVSPGTNGSEVFMSSPLHQVTTLEGEDAAGDSLPQGSDSYDWSPRPSDEVISTLPYQPRTPRVPHNTPNLLPTLPPDLSLPPSPPSGVPRNTPHINVDPSFTTFERSGSYGQTRNLLELNSSSPRMPRGVSRDTHSFLSSSPQVGTSSDEPRNEKLRPGADSQHDIGLDSSSKSLARVSWISSDGSRGSRMLSDQETQELQDRIRKGFEMRSLSSKRSSTGEPALGFYTEEFQHTGSLSVSYPEELDSFVNQESNDSVVYCMGPAGHKCDATCPYIISLRTQEARRAARTYAGPSQEIEPHSSSLEHKLSEEIEDDDWVTEALSQPAGYHDHNEKTKGAGSSLADNSDIGNLSSPRRRPLPLRTPLVHPAHPRYAHTYSVLKDKKSGEDVLIPEYKYGGAAFPYRNVATTPLSNAPKYQHPKPLSKEHTNPFTSSPPSLNSVIRRADIQRQPLSSAENCSMVAHDSRSHIEEEYVAHRRTSPTYQPPFSEMAMKDGERDISHASFQGFSTDALNTKGWFQQAYDGPLNRHHELTVVNSRANRVSPDLETGLMRGSSLGMKRETGSSLADNSSPGVNFSSSSAHQPSSPVAKASPSIRTPQPIAVRPSFFEYSPVSPFSQSPSLRSPQAPALTTPEKLDTITSTLPPSATHTVKTLNTFHRRTHDGISGSLDSTHDDFFERIRNHPVTRDSSIYEDYDYDLDQVSPVVSGFASTELDKHRQDLVEHSLLQRAPSPVKKRRHTAPLEKFSIEEPPATYQGQKKPAFPFVVEITNTASKLLERTTWDNQLKTRSAACRQKVREKMAAMDNSQYYAVNETPPVPPSPVAEAHPPNTQQLFPNGHLEVDSSAESDSRTYRAVVQPKDMRDQARVEEWVNLRAATDPSPTQVNADRKMNEYLRKTRGPRVTRSIPRRPREEIFEPGRAIARAESPHLHPSPRQLRENRANELNDRHHYISGLVFTVCVVFPPFALIYGYGYADGIMAMQTDGELLGFHEGYKKAAIWWGWGGCVAIFAVIIFFFVWYNAR